MTDDHFRKLLWIYLAVTVAGAISSAFPTYSHALQTVVGGESASWLRDNIWASATVLGLLGLAWVIGLIGLFRFRHWGRSVSLYSTLAALAAYPFLGTSLSSGWEDIFYESSAMLWGAILASAYFSPVSARFGR